MSFFSSHPLIQYTFSDGKAYDLVDIFKNIEITVTTPNIVSEYLITSSETPEFIANNIYNNVELSWVVNLTNNILNESEWKVPNSVKRDRLETRYGNQKVYSIETLPDLQKNDIIVLTSSIGGNTYGSYSYVTAWDPVLRAISVIIPDNSDDGFTSAGADRNISFVRTTSSGIVGPMSFLGMGQTLAAGTTNTTQILKITNYVDYPQKFTKEGQRISPYYNITGSGNTYINNETLLLGGTNGFTATLLYRFDTGVIGASFGYTSISSGYTSDNVDVISIINKVYVKTIQRKIYDSMKSKKKNNNITI